MTGIVEARLQQAYLVRVVEEELLRLFAAGKLSGTTHTCIGQEMSAVALAENLDRERDIVVSNHRCHGHYLSWTDDVQHRRSVHRLWNARLRHGL
jgi:TPP-dependent pyruvate/acetoin dehydrogenase alpha subunit